MKVKYLALIISAFCTTGAMAAKETGQLENKLAQLEARLEKAESRAAKAEAQIQALEQQRIGVTSYPVVVESTEPAAGQAAPKLTLSGYGDIKFYGDVEFNMDAASRTGSLTSVKNVGQ